MVGTAKPKALETAPKKYMRSCWSQKGTLTVFKMRSFTTEATEELAQIIKVSRMTRVFVKVRSSLS
jgi:hypothetical protein